MKKVILSLALFAGLATAAQAQDGARIGIRAGISANTLSGDNTDDLTYALGGLGGLTANFPLSEKVSIQPELLYNLKGTQFDDTSVRLDLHYVDLPIFVKYRTGGFYVEAGPQVGYLLSAKLGGEDKASIETDQLQRFQFGYAAGLGYYLTEGLSLGLRFNGGINSVGKDDGALDQQRTQSFNFVVGYEFGSK
jgi:opacity protein-like surface antigen